MLSVTRTKAERAELQTTERSPSSSIERRRSLSLSTQRDQRIVFLLKRNRKNENKMRESQGTPQEHRTTKLSKQTKTRETRQSGETLRPAIQTAKKEDQARAKEGSFSEEELRDEKPLCVSEQP